MNGKVFGGLLAALALALPLTGCKMPGGNKMQMNLPDLEQTAQAATSADAIKTQFYANGFPTDLRVDDQGDVYLDDFPRQYHYLTRRYLQAVKNVGKGYHTVMPIYLPFSRTIDLDAMSDWDLDYASDEAPIQLIDVDPDSNEYGRRFPLSLSMTKMDDQYRPSNLLQVYPTMGVTLRPDTTYAVIVTDQTPLSDINYWQQDEQLAAALGLETDGVNLSERVAKVYEPLKDFLEYEQIDPEQIVGATVWTTGNPIAQFNKGGELVAKRAEQMTELPVTNIENLKNFPEYCIVRADVEVPGYQKGKVPFYTKGGEIEWDEEGAPIVQYTRTTEFVVTIPKDIEMPENGYPLLSYVHGAAGIARQVFERGDFDYYDITRYPYYIAKDGEGPSQIAAQRGWATSGIGQHLSVDHLPDLGVGTIAAGFNPYNPDGFSNHYVTITYEAIYFRRILEKLRLDPSLCPEANLGAGQTAFRFDTSKEVSMGQSIGVWGAALKVSADPKPYEGLIISGSGGTWAKAMNASPIYRAGYQYFVINQWPFQKLDDAHPFLMLLEWAYGETDLSVNMEAMMRYPTKSPPHVIGYSGVRDEIFPDPAQRITFMALGSDMLGDDIGKTPNTTLMPHMTLAGINQLAYPTMENFDTPFGSRLNVVMRYPGKNLALLYSGHEVMFEDPEIKHQYGCFLEYISEEQPLIMDVGFELGDPCW